MEGVFLLLVCFCGYVGDSIMLLRSEVKSQEKHVKALKKRCLWSKVLEEVHFFFHHII